MNFFNTIHAHRNKRQINVLIREWPFGKHVIMIVSTSILVTHSLLCLLSSRMLKSRAYNRCNQDVTVTLTAPLLTVLQLEMWRPETGRQNSFTDDIVSFLTFPSFCLPSFHSQGFLLPSNILHNLPSIPDLSCFRLLGGIQFNVVCGQSSNVFCVGTEKRLHLTTRAFIYFL